MFSIRKETPVDTVAIREVNRLAFGGGAEARLVDRLRDEGLVICSLVAEEPGRIVGHILFSKLQIETPDGLILGAALAPMAVVPDRQRQGIGSELVRAGLDLCGQVGVAVVVVLGHPAYYPRFGFSAERARCLQSPYSGDAFMALELKPEALSGVAGTVRYPAAFSDLDSSES